MTKTTEEMIEVMQAYVDGKQIEISNCLQNGWEIITDPGWSWVTCDYRIAVTKPSIDWSHVAKEYKWLAIDQDGDVSLYSSKPESHSHFWSCDGKSRGADFFTSFRPGTCDWRDSLVERPEGI